MSVFHCQETVNLNFHWNRRYKNINLFTETTIKLLHLVLSQLRDKTKRLSSFLLLLKAQKRNLFSDTNKLIIRFSDYTVRNLNEKPEKFQKFRTRLSLSSVKSIFYFFIKVALSLKFLLLQFAEQTL